MRWTYLHFLSWLYINQLWGSRCPEYEPGCCVCQKWREHDEIFNDNAEVTTHAQG